MEVRLDWKGIRYIIVECTNFAFFMYKTMVYMLSNYTIPTQIYIFAGSCSVVNTYISQYILEIN